MTTAGDEVAQLRSELANIRAEFAALKRLSSAPGPAGRISRAGLLRAAGLAAAGAAAGAVALPAATPALADNGSDLVAGQDNQATSTTSLTSSVLTDAALRVSNYYTGAIDDYSDALQAYTFGVGLAALYGRNDAAGGSGVIGYSGNGVGGTFAGGEAPIRLQPASTAGAPTTDNHQQGELYVDSDGSLWLCTGSGSPGAWAEVSSSGGSGSSTLAGDSDVSISSPSDGQILTYDTASGKWKNKTATGGSGWMAPFTAQPTLAGGGWTQVNAASGTLTDHGGCPSVVVPSNAPTGQWVGAYRAIGKPKPYTLTVCLQVTLTGGNGTDCQAGLLLLTGQSGPFESLTLSEYAYDLPWQHWTWPNTWNANVADLSGNHVGIPGPIVWFQIVDDGTNRIVNFGPDGYLWLRVGQEASGTWLEPTQLAFALWKNASVGSALRVLSWEVA